MNISLLEGTLLIINTMIGAGMFVNAIPLFFYLKSYSFLLYLFVGVLIFPLIMVSFIILKNYNNANFFELGQKINSFTGSFISWNYFLGKMASVGIGILFGSNIINFLLSNFININYKIIAYIILIFYTLCSFFNLKISKSLIYIFFIGKLLSIFSIVSFVFLYINKQDIILNLHPSGFDFSLFVTCIPFAIFSFSGFESFFSISKNVRTKPYLAILYGFFAVLLIYGFYQYIISAMLIKYPLNGEPFLTYFSNVLYNKSYFLANSFFIGLALSSLGIAYSIFKNSTYTLKNIKTLLSSYSEDVRLKIFAIKGFILSFLYIYFASIQKLYILQQISLSAPVLIYTMFVYLFLKTFSKNRSNFLLGLLAIISFLIIFISILFQAYTISYIGYLIYAIISILMYFYIFFFVRKTYKC